MRRDRNFWLVRVNWRKSRLECKESKQHTMKPWAWAQTDMPTITVTTMLLLRTAMGSRLNFVYEEDIVQFNLRNGNFGGQRWRWKRCFYDSHFPGLGLVWYEGLLSRKMAMKEVEAWHLRKTFPDDMEGERGGSWHFSLSLLFFVCSFFFFLLPIDFLMWRDQFFSFLIGNRRVLYKYLAFWQEWWWWYVVDVTLFFYI